ncbi:MAG: hypothetical protein NXI28_12435 [bacterium]|nr:hypothetical protein [bacterium]
MRQVFNVSPDASAWVNGKEVENSYILEDGDSLEFTRTFGHKGGLHDFWSRNELIEFFGESEFRQMEQAGMKLSSQPVMTAGDVVTWNQWLRERVEAPSQKLFVRVDIESESITFRGKTYDIDQQLAAVVKCLVEARGMPCSTTDMKEAYPEYMVDNRLDTTIRRKLITHKSGIGHFIRSDTRGYRLQNDG